MIVLTDSAYTIVDGRLAQEFSWLDEVRWAKQNGGLGKLRKAGEEWTTDLQRSTTSRGNYGGFYQCGAVIGRILAI